MLLDAANLTSQSEEVSFEIAKFEFAELKNPLMVIVWILIGIVAKLVFNLSTRLSQIFPDSSLLLVLGLVVGAILHFATPTYTDSYVLESSVFFHYLLPPIVLDAGYFMPNRLLFINIGTVITFALFGTLFNVVTIGLSLWGLGHVIDYISGGTIDLLTIFLFTSLISAVDPVAVLAVFEEIQVNKTLYISVFGESLFNDAVTMVLYHMFESYCRLSKVRPPGVHEYFLGIVSFLHVSLMGILVGIFLAVITSFATKYTARVRLLEPLLVLSLAYASYLIAEGFGLSSILAIVTYGQFVRQYISVNIHPRSKTTLNYSIKTLSTCSETVIFIYLGLSACKHSHVWSWAFIGLTLLFCLLYRSLGVFIQCFFLNKTRISESKFSLADQVIIAYGGLRGAIAYGLAASMHVDENDANASQVKDMFLTTTIIVVIFTVFVQGTTIKPLVSLLKVKKDDMRHVGVGEKTFELLLDNTVAMMQSVIDTRGHMRIMMKLDQLNEKVLWRILISSKAKQTLNRANARLQKVLQHEKTIVKDMISHSSLQENNRVQNPQPARNNTVDNLRALRSQFRTPETHIDMKMLRRKSMMVDENGEYDVTHRVAQRKASEHRLRHIILSDRSHRRNTYNALTPLPKLDLNLDEESDSECEGNNELAYGRSLPAPRPLAYNNETFVDETSNKTTRL